MKAPIVLLHGMWCTANLLEQIALPLQEAGHPVYAPTLPLHRFDLDASQRRELGRTSLLDYTRYLATEIQKLDLKEPPTLVGHSMGGLLAQMLAARIDCRGIALIAPASPAGINIIQPSSTLATSFILLNGLHWRRANFPPKWHAHYGILHRFPPQQRDDLYRQLVQESGRAYFEIVFWFMDRRKASRVAAEHIQVPVLIQAGGKDRIIVPRVARRIAKRYTQAEFRLYSELGHMMFLEPGGEAVTADLLQWLDELGPTDAAGAGAGT
jgi:pimeloyl-ACP methyl ester carboxylesterase